MDTTMKPQTPTTPRRLTRSRTDRMLGGVAGGIAETYGFDPNLVRLGLVVLALATLGTGVVAYGVAWLIVPEADADEPVLASAVRGARRRPYDPRLWIGVALVLIGSVTLADRFRLGVITRTVWPLLLIGGGAALLLLRDRTEPERPRPDPAGVADAADVTEAPGSPEAPATPDTPDTPGTTEWPEAPQAPESPPEPGSSASSSYDRGAPPPPSAYPPSLPWPVPPRPKLPRPPRLPPRLPRRRERSLLGRFTWSALLIVAGVAWLTDLTGAAAVDGRFILALELGIVGVALLVGAWFGRSRGLIAIGIVLAFFAGAFAVLDVPLRGEIGQVIVRPAAIGTIDRSYHMAMGHLELDLRETNLDGKPHRVVLSDAMGFIEVFVPADARVQVKARSDVGSLDILNRPELSGTDEHTVVIDDPPGASGARILIDAHVGFGAVKVTRTPAPVDVAAVAALEVSR
jgi:phage shock protein PspC (stress-responsive transcriptional regulator)